MFPLNRYKYIIDEDKKVVIAVSSYCGKKVYGRAFCSEKDEFDPEIGKMLAAARCDLKVCQKRANRAAVKRSAVIDLLAGIYETYMKMEDYKTTSEEELEESKTRLANREKRLACKK